METNFSNEEAEVPAYINKFNDYQRKCALMLSTISESPEDSYLTIHSILNINDRTQAYELLLLDATVNRKVESEEKFLEKELRRYYSLLNIPAEEINKNRMAFHNIKKYISFLEDKQVRLKQGNLDQIHEQFSKMRVCIPKLDFIILTVMSIKDSGVVSEDVSDYRIAQYIEENFIDSKGNPFKNVKQEISKLRRMEYDIDKKEEIVKEMIQKTNIKINDPLSD